MPKTIDDTKAKVIYAFLEANVRPRFEKIIKEVNEYLSNKHGVQVGADLEWLVHEVSKEEYTNGKKN